MIIKEAKVAEKILDDHKVEAVESVDVRSLTPFASYYVLGTCDNPRQLKAVAEAVVDGLEGNGYEVRKPEGEAGSGWILVDAGEVIVHLFLPEMRKTIDLDSLLKGRKAK
jgi:ribosome-associated protein